MLDELQEHVESIDMANGKFHTTFVVVVIVIGFLFKKKLYSCPQNFYFR